MGTDVQLDQMEVTRSERLLALILAVFILIGALWIYAKLDEPGRPAFPQAAAPTPAQQQSLTARDRAQAASGRAAAARTRAAETLELRREAYRTALDAGRPADDLEREYLAAQAAFEAADREAREARDALALARGPAATIEKALADERDRAARRYDEDLATHERVTFAVRLVYALGALALAYWWFGRVRRRRPRLVPIAMASVGAAAVLVAVMAGDYATDYFDVADLGPIVLSLAGIALTIGAFLALQRHLARRVPANRVRKGECPFCGYPVRDGDHCSGCGRQVVGACAKCQRPRRIGTLHCSACGGD